MLVRIWTAKGKWGGSTLCDVFLKLPRTDCNSKQEWAGPEQDNIMKLTECKILQPYTCRRTQAIFLSLAELASKREAATWLEAEAGLMCNQIPRTPEATAVFLLQSRDAHQWMSWPVHPQKQQMHTSVRTAVPLMFCASTLCRLESVACSAAHLMQLISRTGLMVLH